MKNSFPQLLISFLPYIRGLAAFGTATLVGLATVRADSPTETWTDPGSSILKSGAGSNWAPPSGGGGPVPLTGTTAVIYGNEERPLGWNTNTNPNAQNFGDLDFTFLSGSSSTLAVGNYTTKTTSANVNVTLGGSTLNSQANTVIANSSGYTIVFENDIDPTGDYGGETGLTTYTLGNSTNVIQATASSNIVIDNVVAGSGAALTFLGGGNSSTTGATLELGAGSANDVTGEAAPNAGTAVSGTFATGIGSVQSSDQNSFTGGLTIGDTAGTANAGVVKIDGAHALPTSGAVTVNPNSQLLLNGNATYGGSTQKLVLNGTGTPGTNGALTTASGNASTWNGNIVLGSAASINVQGATGALIVSGTLSGSSQLQTTGAVSVTGGTLSSSVGSLNIGGTLSLSTGVIALDQSNFSLATGQNFTMSGGTFDLTDVAGSVGSVASAGGGSQFSITSGVLDLGGNTWNYTSTYDILSGFGSGSVSGLTITDYDSTDYTAHVSSAGVLSFTAASVPEPGSCAVVGLGAILLAAGSRRFRCSDRKA